MADVYATAARFQARLAVHDRDARRRIDAVYRAVTAKLEPEIAALTDAIAARRAAGQPIPISWLHDAARLPRLLAAIQRELRAGVPELADIVAAEREAAATSSVDDALQLLRDAVGDPRLQLASLRPELVAQAVGQTESAAVRGLLRTLPADAAQRVEQAIVQGVALQRGPERVSRDIAHALDGNRTRARTIARTEMHRAYREASRRTWRAQGELVAGWEWLCSLDRRSCAACVAMHGTTHPLDEPMQSHPNCRCTMVPTLRRQTAETPRLDSGEAEFSRWPEADQLATVGPSKLAAIKAGDITLGDLVRVRRSPLWGETRTVASLPDAYANAARRRATRRAAA